MHDAKDCAALFAADVVPDSQLEHPFGKPPHAPVVLRH
jgi:hypothetical protein